MADYSRGSSPYTMPFGKYRGTPVDQLPLDYCIWLIDNVDLYEPLVTHVYARLTSGRAEHQQSVDQPADYRPERRRFAAKYHPDLHGGNPLPMRVVNDILDHLEGQT